MKKKKFDDNVKTSKSQETRGVDAISNEEPSDERNIALEILDAPQSADAKLLEMQDRYQRCLAEFDNYRKRTAKEMAARYDDGVRAACEKLLSIVDNFERALHSHENKDDPFFKGIEMIARQFDATLNELGVKEIQIDNTTAFDANFHYAVAHVEDENFGENSVAEILQKGYLHKEKIIRPAMVKVAN
jgi:molecular chaperone GrpE